MNKQWDYFFKLNIKLNKIEHKKNHTLNSKIHALLHMHYSTYNPLTKKQKNKKKKTQKNKHEKKKWK